MQHKARARGSCFDAAQAVCHHDYHEDGDGNNIDNVHDGPYDHHGRACKGRNDSGCLPLLHDV